MQDWIESFLGQESKSTSIMVREHWTLSNSTLVFSSQGVWAKASVKLKSWLMQFGTEEVPKAIPKTGSDVQC